MGGGGQPPCHWKKCQTYLTGEAGFPPPTIRHEKLKQVFFILRDVDFEYLCYLYQSKCYICETYF